MYNSGNKQFIFRQSNGDIWNFYHDYRYGLCYNTLTKRNTWTNPVSLHKSAFQSFFAEMDPDDRFHILFQDNLGNVNYSFMDKDSIKTVPVLNSKAPTAYNKHLCLIPFKNSICFFYVLRQESSPIFAYQVLSEEKISNPRVIDYVSDNICPYSVLMDKNQNIYAFYQTTDGKHLQLGYKKYNMQRKLWNEFAPVSKYDGDCEFPRVISDSSGIMHLSYQRKAGKQFELVYQQKTPDKNIWSNEVVIHVSGHSFDDSSIFWVNDNVIIYWVRDDIIYYCLGTQSGNVWEKPLRYSFPTTHKLLCMSYKSNNAYEIDKTAIVEIPGSFAGGLKLAFYQQPSDNGENLSAEELRTLILDSLKLLKVGMEDLKDSGIGLRDDLNKYGNRQKELEKDIVKQAVKLDALESDSIRIRSLSARLEEIAAELKVLKSGMEKSEEEIPL
ncbi:MAG: hypothetical protein FIA99_09880 [Ruminiclostridium sp.]|nr:hypothetical protein [Ruminiclostridium sp.]